MDADLRRNSPRHVFRFCLLKKAVNIADPIIRISIITKFCYAFGPILNEHSNMSIHLYFQKIYASNFKLLYVIYLPVCEDHEGLDSASHAWSRIPTKIMSQFYLPSLQLRITGISKRTRKTRPVGWARKSISRSIGQCRLWVKAVPQMIELLAVSNINIIWVKKTRESFKKKLFYKLFYYTTLINY